MYQFRYALQQDRATDSLFSSISPCPIPWATLIARFKSRQYAWSRMSVPLFTAELAELPAFLDVWPQIVPEPGTQTETLLWWLSWGTYALNTPQGLIPAVATAMQQADPHDFSDQGSVLAFAEALGEAVGNLRVVLPPPLDAWVASGRWQAWLGELWRRWHADGQVESAEQQETIRLLLEVGWMIPASSVEFAFTDDGQGETHSLGFRRVGGEVEVAWRPSAVEEGAVQFWLPERGRLRVSEERFFSEVKAFREWVRGQLEERLSLLTAEGHIQRAEVALGKEWLHEALGPVGVGRPVNAEVVLAVVARLEAQFGLRVEACSGSTGGG